jgi:insertion element IS1 protein InsB
VVFITLLSNGKPKNPCKDCGRQFVIALSQNQVSEKTKQLIDQLLLEQISWRGIARVTGLSWSWLQNHLNIKFSEFPRQVSVSAKPKGKLTREGEELWYDYFLQE